jgi:hypothetical protein
LADDGRSEGSYLVRVVLQWRREPDEDTISSGSSQLSKRDLDVYIPKTADGRMQNKIE